MPTADALDAHAFGERRAIDRSARLTEEARATANVDEES